MICSIYYNDNVFLCGRETKVSTTRKRSHKPSMFAITESEEADRHEPEAAEPSSTGELKVSPQVCF